MIGEGDKSLNCTSYFLHVDARGFNFTQAASTKLCKGTWGERGWWWVVRQRDGDTSDICYAPPYTGEEKRPMEGEWGVKDPMHRMCTFGPANNQ